MNRNTKTIQQAISITALINNIEEWDKYLQFWGYSSHSGHINCFSVKEGVPKPGGLECLHVQVLRRAGKRFVSKGNIRHLLWHVMKQEGGWEDAPVEQQGGVIQLKPDAGATNEKNAIRKYPELDLFGYMYTGNNGVALTRKSVVGITKLEEVGEDLWRVSFTIDTARLGRIRENEDLLYREDEFKKRLAVTLKSIYKLFGECPQCCLFVAAPVRVPVPVFGTIRTCSEQELNHALQNGWIIKENTFIQKNKMHLSHKYFDDWLNLLIENNNLQNQKMLKSNSHESD